MFAAAVSAPAPSSPPQKKALGEFAILTDAPDDVRRRLLSSASNFGLSFYGLLHKFGVAQKPSLFIDGTPVLGPAAEALNPAAYNAAAAAAGLTRDAQELQVGRGGSTFYFVLGRGVLRPTAWRRLRRLG